MEKVQIVIQKKSLLVRFTQEKFESEWESWKQKLQQLTLLYQGKPEVFFVFPELDFKRINECLQEMEDKIRLVGLENKKKEESNFVIVQNKLRGGMTQRFKNGGLVIGNVDQDVQIILESGNLYILGNLLGQVECLDNHSVLYAHTFRQARISFDGCWQISTKLTSPVRYDNQEAKKEGEMYGKMFDDYQW